MRRMGKRSPTFLAPGTGFVEDSFSTDGWGGEVQMMESDEGRQMKLSSLISYHESIWKSNKQTNKNKQLKVSYK